MLLDNLEYFRRKMTFKNMKIIFILTLIYSLDHDTSKFLHFHFTNPLDQELLNYGSQVESNYFYY